MTRRFWIGVALGAPVFLLAMGDMVHGRRDRSRARRVDGELDRPGARDAGRVLVRHGRSSSGCGRSIVHASPNMFTLIGIGVGAAYVYSAVGDGRARAFPGRLPDARRASRPTSTRRRDHRAGAARPGAGAARARTAPARRSGSSSASRRRPRGSCATARRGRAARRRRRRRSCCGSVLARRFRSTASSSTAQRRSTSRWSPASRSRSTKAAGDRVVTGATIVANGSFVMRAERVGADTLLAQIVRMVGEAQRTRAPIQRLADRIARISSRRSCSRRSWRSRVWALWGPAPRLAHALRERASLS